MAACALRQYGCGVGEDLAPLQIGAVHGAGPRPPCTASYQQNSVVTSHPDHCNNQGGGAAASACRSSPFACCYNVCCRRCLSVPELACRVVPVCITGAHTAQRRANERHRKSYDFHPSPLYLPSGREDSPAYQDPSLNDLRVDYSRHSCTCGPLMCHDCGAGEHRC